jgi:hypothetical protein
MLEHAKMANESKERTLPKPWHESQPSPQVVYRPVDVGGGCLAVVAIVLPRQSASVRPAPGQAGTLRQQLAAIEVYHRMPIEVRDWQTARAAVMEWEAE